MKNKAIELIKDRLTGILSDHSVEAIEISTEELARITTLWKRVFGSRVRRQYGTSVYRGFKWHGFSYGIEPCLSGQTAREAYQLKAGPFYVFDEMESFGYLCRTSTRFRIDLSELHQDIYITNKQVSWTMVFTHEQPALGPFFAEATANSS
jgi:hypothetical protein